MQAKNCRIGKKVLSEYSTDKPIRKNHKRGSVPKNLNENESFASSNSDKVLAIQNVRGSKNKDASRPTWHHCRQNKKTWPRRDDVLE